MEVYYNVMINAYDDVAMVAYYDVMLAITLTVG